MRNFKQQAIFKLFFSATVLALVHAHSHLAQPLPDRELHCRVGNERRDCHGPCPPDDDYGRLNPVNRNQPAEVWGRGQWVNVRWHKDNHDGTGFVRLALVPVDKMRDKHAHDKYAFAFVCMNEGLHVCPDMSYDVCGNDFEGKAWQKTVQVPTSYPDGVYAFGWSWYGGGNYLDRSFFGDYYSCSYVEIRGGALLSNEYHPVWDGGATGTCRSATDRLGVCWREPCDVGRMHEMIPYEFNGRIPEPIRRADLERDNGHAHGTGVSLGGSSGGSSVFGGGTFVSSGGGGGSGTSVSLGARSRGDRNRDSGNGGDGGGDGGGGEGGGGGGGGALGVFFLDFKDWSKVAVEDGKHYRMADFDKGMTVEAFYNGQVRYMEFFVDGVLVRKEKTGPFVMNGNKGHLIHGWAVPQGRMIKLRVVCMSANGHSETFQASFRFD